MAKDLQSSSMNWTQIIGLAAGVLTASSLIPQVVKTWKEKKAEDVSLLMLVILLSGIVLWIVYGIKKAGFTDHCYQFGFPSRK